MKCLLLAPARYPFVRAIQAGLEANDLQVRAVDYHDFFSDRINRLLGKFTSLPRRIKKTWEEPYTREVNEQYQAIFDQFRPDLVFIYNDQLVFPELLDRFGQSARIAFMLGDNPLYTPASNLYNLPILFKADYVISPDSKWCEQLSRLGIKNIVFDCFGYTENIFYPFDPSEADREKHGSDLVFVGNISKRNWGYQRMLFLNAFRDLELRAYLTDKGIDRWSAFFPGLEKRIVHHDRHDATFNNLVYNCSKMAPIDLVPSLFNGVHVRVFDALGAGILPLCEYSLDLERVFSDIDAPFIRDYRAAAEVARYWLENEEKRLDCIQAMQQRVEENYAPINVARRMLEGVFQTRLS